MEYITVKEYIEIKDITFNDFWKMYFNGYFDGYSKEENGNTYILKSFLDTCPDEKREIQKESKKESKSETNDNISIKTDDESTAELKAEIERLKNVIAEKDKKIIEFAEKFAELSQQALQITSQGQYIQALDKAQENNNSTENNVDVIIPDKKQSILKRIFRKK